MKKGACFLGAILLSVALCGADIIKLADIKAGMEGEGKTIFKGTQVETFRFRVLGVMERFAPDKNLIMVELISPELSDGGIIAGMSGSPVYIGGKIAGAVAYGFNFAKKPIAGVTPIEDMIRVAENNNPNVSIDISNIQVKFDKENIRRISELLFKELQARSAYSPQPSVFPIQLLSSSRGLKSEILSFLQPLISAPQDLKIRSDLAQKPLPEDMFRVSAGDAVSIPLVRGDYEYSVSGTVTHVDGNQVYMFGHPFFNLGTVEFPLHRAEIISVVPSYESAFKLAVTRNPVGMVEQDRFSGLQAQLGKSPYLIPVRIFLKNRNRSLKLEIVNHPLLTPGLTYLSLLNTFASEFKEVGFQSLAVTGKIFIENEDNVVLSDMFSGTSSFDEFASLVLAVDFFLMNNKEKSIRIQKMDFEISGLETVKRADLENVLIAKSAFAPGETINVSLFLKNEKGAAFQEQLSLRAPNLRPGSVLLPAGG